MKIELIKYSDIGRSFFALYPDGDRLSCYENTLVTVLQDEVNQEQIEGLISDPVFQDLVNSQRLVMLFPLAIGGQWNWDMDQSQQDDLADLNHIIDKFHYQLGVVDQGVYHNMHNARFFVGTGTGASMLHTLAACQPVNVAGVFTIGGAISPKAKEYSVNSPVPALLWNASEEVVAFYKSLNKTDQTQANHHYNRTNDAQFVKVAQEMPNTLEGQVFLYGWKNLFSIVCRSNASEYGDVGPRLVKDDYQFKVYENDTRLGDNCGLAHTWFEYLPSCLNAEPEKKVPLLVFNHGFADTPGNLANTTQLHKVAEQEGFILVFPWSSTQWGWNQDMVRNDLDDVAFLAALIDYLKKAYPIDETRVYIGGFSNGSAMAQVFAMTHPETIAAVFALNTRWCQDRNTKPFAIAGKKKLDYDFRMPVWYTYGTRDFEYPVVRGSGQQVQYDFWKAFNNITHKETPYCDHPDESGVGVPGDLVEEYYPNPRYPERRYTVHRFFSEDPEKLNLYNYTLAHGKGHDASPEESWLGWNYIKQFSRLNDGSLVVNGKVFLSNND